MANYGALNETPHSEIIQVPDRMVGLIIGKSGEQISNIQTASECRIQFAPETFGMPERPCTLTGSFEAIKKAKEMIVGIMSKGQSGPFSMILSDMQLSSTHITIELMIPGTKAGVIIGKGGETIKQLQDELGVKMVIIQESNSPSNFDKPLRITGERVNCIKAKEKVLSLLAEKEGGGDFYNNNHKTSIDIPVSRSMVGIVIGKGGEMIKKIQQESGARVQFRVEDETAALNSNRLCNITGNSEQMQTAIGLIQEIVEQKQDLLSSLNKNLSNFSLDSSDAKKAAFETFYIVSADKCGLVIGKGGDTIREICKMSGAHLELVKDAINISQSERLFKLIGSQEQIQQAVQLVAEKIGMSPIPYSMINSLNNSNNNNNLMNHINNNASNNAFNNMLRDNSNTSNNTNNVSNNHLFPGLYSENNSLQAMQQVLQMQQQQQQGQQQQQPQQQAHNYISPLPVWPTTAFPAAYAPANIPQSSMEQFKQAEMQAHWAAQLYGQQHPQQQQLQQLLSQQQLQQLITQQQQTQQTPNYLTRTAALSSPAGGGMHADVNLQWADYYRQQGMHHLAQ